MYLELYLKILGSICIEKASPSEQDHHVPAVRPSRSGAANAASIWPGSTFPPLSQHSRPRMHPALRAPASSAASGLGLGRRPVSVHSPLIFAPLPPHWDEGGRGEPGRILAF